MENHNMQANFPLASKRVHYAESAQDQEEIPFKDNYSDCSEVSRSSIKYSGDCNSEISVATSILDTEENDVNMLRNKLEECEAKLKLSENENRQIIDDLLNERTRSSKLEKKLQFVRDNQDVFMRLKEAYINMKYNEAAGRKMIEIREKSVQTWDGILCNSCIETEELRRQIDVTFQKYKELFVVSPGEMEHLINTVKYLKDLIDRREETWENNMNRELKLQTHVAVLENENANLRAVISKKGSEVPKEVLDDIKLEQKLLEERKAGDMQKFVESITKDLDKLKKIIIKYEKKFREFKEYYPGKYTSPLNEKEAKLVQQIIAKHNAKVQGKDHTRSRSPSIAGTEPLYRPSSTSARSYSFDRPQTPKSCTMRTDSAILMMDYLFE
ncbi:uncharacterized protein LOC109538677 [Dendroctonus ponderosae]